MMRQTPMTSASIYLLGIALLTIVLSPGLSAADNSTAEETPPNKEPTMHELLSVKCEAGHPCSEDQWCSPNHKRCRPCSDVRRWCPNSTLIHDRYPTCEPYCYRTQRVLAETYKDQKETMQKELNYKDSIITNLTERANAEKNEKDRASSQKEKLRETLDVKELTIKIMGVSLTVIGLLAFVVSAYLLYTRFCLPCQAEQQTPDPELAQAAGSNDSQTKPLMAEPVSPIQDNTKDSGKLYLGTNRHVAPRVTGNHQVVV